MTLPLDATRVFMLASTLVTGGAERVFESLAYGLPELGYDPEILCLHAPGAIGESLIEAGVPVRHGLIGAKYDPFSPVRISRIFSGRSEGILLSLDHHDAIATGIAAARLAGLHKRVLSIHSTGLWGKGSSFTRLDRLFLGGFGRIVALAGMHRDHLVDVEHIDPGKISVINNGVDTERFAPADDATRGSLREELGIEAGRFAVSIVAALRPEKNHQMFLAAAALLKKRHGDRFIFLITGSGTEEERLREISSRLGLDDSVRFLGERTDVERVLKASDVSVLCSLPVVETFPLAVLEAMATGIPVVSTGVGSVPEIIEDGVDGMIIESGDMEGLVSAIEVFDDDRKEAALTGARARLKAEDKYSVRGMVDSYARLFDEMSAPDNTVEKR
jgi:glycosyltransferase involved in cell wall biosynthesis